MDTQMKTKGKEKDNDGSDRDGKSNEDRGGG